MPPPNLPRLAVLLVHYQGWQTTASCLHDLLAQTYPNFFIQVADNGPDLNDFQALSAEFGARLTLAPKLGTGPIFWEFQATNLGYGGGMNRAAWQAAKKGAEVFIVLNNDTRFTPDFLRCFTEQALPLSRQADFALAVPLIYEEDGPGIYYAGGHLNLKRCMGEHRTQTPSDPGPQEVDFATACCWWIPRTRYEEMGGFVESLFLYFEDFDFCYRLKQKGYKQYFLPAIPLRHEVGGSTGGDQSPVPVYYGTRNRLLWMKENRPKQWIAFLLFFLSSRLLKAFSWLIQGRIKLLPPLLKGIKDGLKGVRGRP